MEKGSFGLRWNLTRTTLTQRRQSACFKTCALRIINRVERTNFFISIPTLFYLVSRPRVLEKSLELSVASRKSRVPHTFQLAAILPSCAYLASRKINNLTYLFSISVNNFDSPASTILSRHFC